MKTIDRFFEDIKTIQWDINIEKQKYIIDFIENTKKHVAISVIKGDEICVVEFSLRENKKYEITYSIYKLIRVTNGPNTKKNIFSYSENNVSRWYAEIFLQLTIKTFIFGTKTNDVTNK